VIKQPPRSRKKQFTILNKQRGKDSNPTVNNIEIGSNSNAEIVEASMIRAKQNLSIQARLNCVMGPLSPFPKEQWAYSEWYGIIQCSPWHWQNPLSPSQFVIASDWK
jgi:hypothetical protein